MRIDAQEQSWPLDKPFRIARGTRNEARVVVVTVSDEQYTGRGEAVPLARYGQSGASVLAQIELMKAVPSLDRQQIQKLLPAGAARNALDCALWDLKRRLPTNAPGSWRTSRRRGCGRNGRRNEPERRCPVASSGYGLLVFLSVAVTVRVIVGEPPMPVTVKT